MENQYDENGYLTAEATASIRADLARANRNVPELSPEEKAAEERYEAEQAEREAVLWHANDKPEGTEFPTGPGFNNGC